MTAAECIQVVDCRGVIFFVCCLNAAISIREREDGSREYDSTPNAATLNLVSLSVMRCVSEFGDGATDDSMTDNGYSITAFAIIEALSIGSESTLSHIEAE